MVCTAVVTVLQGYCQCFALWSRLDSLISILGSPLVGPRPFLLLPLFHPSAPRSCVWVIVASCGTGWASTSSCNHCPPFHNHLSTTGFLRWHRINAHCLSNLDSHTGRYLSQVTIFSLRLQYFPTFGTSGLPLRTVDMRALGVAN